MLGVVCVQLGWGEERGEREGGEREGEGGGMESSRDTNTGGILPFLYIV